MCGKVKEDPPNNYKTSSTQDNLLLWYVIYWRTLNPLGVLLRKNCWEFLDWVRFYIKVLIQFNHWCEGMIKEWELGCQIRLVLQWMPSLGHVSHCSVPKSLMVVCTRTDFLTFLSYPSQVSPLYSILCDIVASCCSMLVFIKWTGSKLYDHHRLGENRNREHQSSCRRAWMPFNFSTALEAR